MIFRVYRLGYVPFMLRTLSEEGSLKIIRSNERDV